MPSDHINGLITPRRLTIGTLCVLALVVCCGLAVWQWQRFSAADGDLQNLGYVLLWPLFGLFPAFVVWRMRQLRAQHAAETIEQSPEQVAEQVTERSDGQSAEATATAARPQWVPRGRPTVVREDEADDPELAAYNRYLAQLHAADQQETR